MNKGNVRKKRVKDPPEGWPYTRKTRVRLDFVYLTDEPKKDMLPEIMNLFGNTNRFLVAGLNSLGVTTGAIAPGTRVTIGLDYRKPKKPRSGKSK